MHLKRCLGATEIPLAFATNRPPVSVALRAPVIVMVLAATAIPIELRPLDLTVGFDIQASDVIANVGGYVPIGIVLGGLGWLRALITAVLLAAFAETSQLLMVHRNPSVIDLVSNAVGAILGILATVRWSIRSPEMRIDGWKAVVAATSAVMVLLVVWATTGNKLNARGATSPGTLEAYWKLDESRGRSALDSSAHALLGRFHGEPTRVSGVAGAALRFDGPNDYLDFGHATAFRLVASMTVSAWINSSSFPADDAAIVSSYDHRRDQGGGYQLDTTVDTGHRTIGFKLADICGRPVARYGATPLALGRWYHVAGVYDADAQTLDVYLDGKRDSGVLRGTVPVLRRSSREGLYVGRRSDLAGYEFAGVVDEVRIYSSALTEAQIMVDMHGTVVDALAGQPVSESNNVHGRSTTSRGGVPGACPVTSDREDAKIPIAAAALGLLVAVACVGFWQSAGWVLSLAVSLAAGLVLLLLVVATPSTLPPLNLWTIPITSLAGGASLVVARRLNTLR